MAFPRKNRLSRTEFNGIFNNAKTVRGGFFFVRFVNNKCGYGRVAVSVAVKVSKKSTQRNRIRRIISNAVHGAGLLKKSIDAVFVVTSDISSKPPSEIKKEIDKITAGI